MKHVQHKLLGRLILTQMGTYIEQSALEMTTYDELVNVDHKNTRLPHKDVVLPEPVVKLMEELGIGPRNLFLSSTASWTRCMHSMQCALIDWCTTVRCNSPTRSWYACLRWRSDDTMSAKVIHLQKKFGLSYLYCAYVICLNVYISRKMLEVW